MRRAVLTIGGTVAGLAALLSFRTHSLAATTPAASAPTTPAASAPPASTGTTGTAGSAHPATSKSATATAKASTSTGAGAGTATTTRTLTGTAETTPYGPMQVEVTLAGTKITNVTVLQRTNDGSTSDQIDANAIPKLTSETLAAQSASIDAVSGASYTSSGYIKSLQSALDKA
jgi:uncharacterized protein with FMN-binding domain